MPLAELASVIMCCHKSEIHALPEKLEPFTRTWLPADALRVVQEQRWTSEHGPMISRQASRTLQPCPSTVSRRPRTSPIPCPPFDLLARATSRSLASRSRPGNGTVTSSRAQKALRLHPRAPPPRTSRAAAQASNWRTAPRASTRFGGPLTSTVATCSKRAPRRRASSNRRTGSLRSSPSRQPSARTCSTASTGSRRKTRPLPHTTRSPACRRHCRRPTWPSAGGPPRLPAPSCSSR